MGIGTVIWTIFLLLAAVGGFVSYRIAAKKLKAARAELKTPAPQPAQQSSGRGRGGFSSSYDDDSAEISKARIKKLSAEIFLQNIIRWSSLGASAVAILLIALMCVTSVSAKNVGVAVNFGAVSEQTLSPGIQPKLPWTQVIEIDGTIQTDSYKGESCVKVTIGDGSQACATITNRWQINPTNAASIYEQHRSDDPTQSFKAAVISTELEQSISEALKEYNPISQLKIVGQDADATDVSFVPDYAAFSKTIEDDMKERLARTGQAEIIGITFSHLELSPNTQRKLDDYIAAVGETRIAMQQKETAKAQADANRELSSSVSNDPNVLVSRCLDLLKESSQSGYALPPGFSCWPGGGSGVVIPGISG